MKQLNNTPLVLIVLDGFGYSPRTPGNAIAAARTPHFDEWFNKFPTQLIEASGQAVGLPAGQMGNSEVGHLNIGAGRVVRMDVSRIDYAIEIGDFFRNQILIEAMNHAKQRGSSLHLMGLVSDGGVHSSQEHLYALLRMAKQMGNRSVLVHAFLDGRDTAPDSGARYLSRLLQVIDEYQVGQVASVVGRYYAMDRDRRWDRTEQAYKLLVYGEGRKHRSAVDAIRESYGEGITDEFVKPVVIVDERDEPVATVRDGDSIVFFNFRADRARQLTRSLTDESFDGFERERRPEIRLTCLTQYDKMFPLPVAFPPEEHHMILADVLGDAGVRNVRIAETEKYAHVTFFFNGGVEREFPGESRLLVPSPKVATYDLKPEMSAEGITDAVVKAVGKGEFDVLIVNYANADMVGHSGIFDATVRAVEVIDSCLGRVVDAVRRRKGAVVITADHGNAEQMIDPQTGGPFTAHTTNPVPIILINGYHGRLREGGRLEDVAPTLLGMLGIPKPNEMTGSDLRIDRS